MPDSPRPSGRRSTLVAVGYAVLGVLPLFLVSAQSVRLQHDLGFGRAALGLAVSICFIASAMAAAPLGRLVHRIGPSLGLRLSAALSLSALVLLATVVSRWWHVAAALVLSGLANATAQVSTNVVLAGGVPRRRQGVAFGAKQAAIPVASLTAGLALPVVGLVAGWHATFAAAAVLVAAAIAFAPRIAGGRGPQRAHVKASPTRLLVLLAATGLFAGAVGNALPTFMVDSAVSRGISESAGGIVLALGSAAAMLTRVGVGWLADRRRSAGLTELAALTGAGAASCALLAASGDNHALFVLAVVAGFAAGWGWPGLIYFAVVGAHPEAPGAATGFVLSMVYVGNVAGPAGVGFMAQHGSYALAWSVAAVMLSLATAAALAARRLERRGREPRMLHEAPAA